MTIAPTMPAVRSIALSFLDEPVPGYPSLYGLRNAPTYGPEWLVLHPL